MIDALASVTKFRFLNGWLTNLAKALVKAQKDRSSEIDAVTDEFGDPVELAKFYIEPKCQQFNPADDHEEEARYVVREPIFGAIEGFFSGSKPAGMNQIFVLSDAGMGKTSLLLMLFLGHANKFWPRGIECTLLKLGPETLDRIKEISGRKSKILLLDALDEDPCAWGRIETRLSEILNITSNFRRVIITCRTQFFSAGEDPFNRRGQVEVAGHLCPVVYLSLFDDDQVTRYLKKRFKGRPQKVPEAFGLIEKMRSLRFRPMLLAHIEDLMDSETVVWTEYSTYKALVSAWLLREHQKAKKRAEEEANLFSASDPRSIASTPAVPTLWKACETLAVYLHSKALRTVRDDVLRDIVQQSPDLEHISMIEVRGRSLLNKNSKGEYRFSHYSIMEFLLAHLALENFDPTIERSKLRPTDKIVDFIRSWLRTTPPEDRLGARLELFDLEGVDFSSGDFRGLDLTEVILRSAILNKLNAESCILDGAILEGASILSAQCLGASFRGANLGGANIRGSDMQHANLEDAVLRKAVLQDANFSHSNLSSATLELATGPNVKFSESVCKHTVFEKARLEGANFDGADLRGATFAKARLTGASFRNCDLSGARLPSADLRGANFCGARLAGVSLYRAKLSTCNLEGAVISNANVEGADLEGSNLEEAMVGSLKSDAHTIWP